MEAIVPHQRQIKSHGEKKTKIFFSKFTSVMSLQPVKQTLPRKEKSPLFSNFLVATFFTKCELKPLAAFRVWWHWSDFSHWFMKTCWPVHWLVPWSDARSASVLKAKYIRIFGRYNEADHWLDCKHVECDPNAWPHEVTSAGDQTATVAMATAQW